MSASASRQGTKGGTKMKTRKMMRKAITILLSGLMVMAMSVTAFADAVTADGAADIALANAGLSRDAVTMLESEADDGKFEVEFVDNATGNDYSYEIKAADGKILEKSVDYVYSRSKSKKKIGAKAARKKAASLTGVKYKTVKKGSCKYKYKKKQGKYTVKFKSGGYRYEVEVLAPTGAVIELEMEATKK